MNYNNITVRELHDRLKDDAGFREALAETLRLFCRKGDNQDNLRIETMRGVYKMLIMFLIYTGNKANSEDDYDLRTFNLEIQYNTNSILTAADSLGGSMGDYVNAAGVGNVNTQSVLGSLRKDDIDIYFKKSGFCYNSTLEEIQDRFAGMVAAARFNVLKCRNNEIDQNLYSTEVDFFLSGETDILDYNVFSCLEHSDSRLIYQLPTLGEGDEAIPIEIFGGIYNPFVACTAILFAAISRICGIEATDEELFARASREVKALYVNIEEEDGLAELAGAQTNGYGEAYEEEIPVVDLSALTANEREIYEMILAGSRQLVLTGAPGTGKTYSASKIAGFIGKKLPGMKLPYGFVQFHPSYDYTDFIEGLRPVESPGSNSYSFKKVDGSFKHFCREVAEYNERHADTYKNELFFFIIDEVNRADLSKVFGELMYCLEKDKRGKDRIIITQYQNLTTYDMEKGFLTGDSDIFRQGFYIPENIVIIGTMNDIDRSVESMDFALRRRFEWKEFEVNHETLIDAFSSSAFCDVIRENAEQFALALCRMNSVFENEEFARVGLNSQYYISQGLFSNIPEGHEDVLSIMTYCFEKRILPMLKEYLRGIDNAVKIEFLDACREAFFEG